MFILVATMEKCKQINNSNSPYVSEIISLIIHERNYAILDAVFPTLISTVYGGDLIYVNVSFFLNSWR